MNEGGNIVGSATRFAPENSMTVAIRHHIPGRTRLRLHPWPSASSLGQILAMLSQMGVVVESANPVSGSLLVGHDIAISAGDIHRRLESHEWTRLEEIRKPAPDKPARLQSDVGRESELDRLAIADAAMVLREFDSAPSGLESQEANRRLQIHGYNAAPAPVGRSRGEMAVGQFTTFPVALLLGSAILSIATGGIVDAAVTLGVVFANAAIGFSSESATENLIRRLSRPVEHEAAVLRDGVPTTVSAREVVPGDVILLAPGSFVPADARVLQADDLSVDESMLNRSAACRSVSVNWVTSWPKRASSLREVRTSA